MKLLKKYQLPITTFVLGLIIGLLIMSFKIKEKNVSLDQNNVILSIGKEAITSDEYYNNIKEKAGIQNLLDMIDTLLLDQKYSLTKEEIKEQEKKGDELITTYQEYYGTTEKDFLENNGFKDKEDLYNYLILEEKRTLYEKDYLKNQIKASEINYYYNNTLIPDFEIKYLKGDEKTLTEIMTKLKNGTTYDEIVKKYKKVTAKNLGYISFDNKEINPDIYSDAVNLDKNSYTTSLRSIDDEYYIIFKGNIKEKDSIEILKDRITEKLVEEKINADTEGKLYNEALINLRKDNKLTFYDTYFEKLYNTYLKNIK